MNVIRSQEKPLTTQEIFKLAVKQESAQAGPSTSHIAEVTSNVPRYPDHHIKSVQYLKRVVLPSLIESADVEKVHQLHTLTPEEIEQRLSTMTKHARKTQSAAVPSTVDAWKWQLRTNKPAPPTPKPVRQPYGVEVGVGEDFSHLNRRRLRSRALKVGRDVRWMKQLELAKLDGRKASSQNDATAS